MPSPIRAVPVPGRSVRLASYVPDVERGLRTLATANSKLSGLIRGLEKAVRENRGRDAKPIVAQIEAAARDLISGAEDAVESVDW